VDALMGARMSSPAKGYVSSGYGPRGSSFHAGVDIATGGKPGSVYTTFAGTVEKVVRGRRHGDRSSTNMLAPGRTGNGLIVRNADGERQLYGHVDVFASIKVGDRVAVGELVGVTDLSGNTTGYHVHYEEWTRSGATRDPMVSFRAFGVTPGASPAAAYPVTPLPAAPTHEELFRALDLVVRGAKAGGSHTVRAKRLQQWLLDAGYLKTPTGKRGVVDGVWGRESWKALQRRLSDKGLRKPYTGPIDGVAPQSGKAGTTWNCAAAFCNDRRAAARKA